LDAAARLLWDNDCGCLPVVDAAGVLKGMITDRDICMAALSTGRSIAELRVAESMTRDVAFVGPRDALSTAEDAMRRRRVHRLPVVDAERRVVGVLCANDLLRWVDDGGADGPTSSEAVHLVRTLAEICRPRTSVPSRGRVDVDAPASALPSAVGPVAPPDDQSMLLVARRSVEPITKRPAR